MESLEHMSQQEPGGNTSPPVLKNKIVTTQCYRWQFTLKAEPIEPEEPISQAEIIYNNLKPFCKEFYYQLEMGKNKTVKNTVNKGMPDECVYETVEEGYLHYQGCFSLITKHRMNEVKNIIGWNNVHLESPKNWNALKNYCKKEDTRILGPWSHLTNWIKTITVLYPWQKGVVDVISLPCTNERVVYWLWGATGNIGKTAFTKWAAVHLGATVIRGGALKDIAFSIPDDPKIIIFDITRTVEGRVNYEALEACKDGMIFSAKYESRMKVFNSPHVLVFANFEPELDKLSKDRWEVINLEGKSSVSVSASKPKGFFDDFVRL